MPNAREICACLKMDIAKVYCGEDVYCSKVDCY